MKKNLGLIIDDKLNFKSHITQLCKQAFQKIELLCKLLGFIMLRKVLQFRFKISVQLLTSSMNVLLKNIEQHGQ